MQGAQQAIMLVQDDDTMRVGLNLFDISIFSLVLVDCMGKGVVCTSRRYCSSLCFYNTILSFLVNTTIFNSYVLLAGHV